MAKLKVAIIGAGGTMASMRADAFFRNPHAQVVLCASRTHAKAQALARKLQCSAVESWQQAATDPEVKAVCISTPNTLHYEQAKTALEHGKHVLVEYPLCQTIEEADELHDLAGKQGVVLHHALTARTEPLFLAVAEHIPSLGSIACARVTYFGGRNWHVKPDRVGDIFLALHIHFIDYFRGWFGEVQSVCATRHEAGEGESYMHSGTVLLKHERCPAAFVELGVGYLSRPQFTMHVLGSEGLLTKGEKIEFSRGGQTVEVHQGPNIAVKVDTDDFVAHVVEGAKPLRAWKDTRRSMQVSLDCTRSAAAGQQISY